MAAAKAASEKIAVRPFERRKPARRPLPEHLPRERVVSHFRAILSGDYDLRTIMNYIASYPTD